MSIEKEFEKKLRKKVNGISFSSFGDILNFIKNLNFVLIKYLKEVKFENNEFLFRKID